MRTKKCSGCGWEYPYDYPRIRCRFCKTKFTEGVCKVCGKDIRIKNACLCNACRKKWRDDKDTNGCRLHEKARQRIMAEMNLKYIPWMEWIASIPQPYTHLTEKEWLRACAHFNGCAICGDEEISTRKLFIPFSEGGRYCKWNVIPVCEVCGMRRFNKNPFKNFYKKIATQYYTEDNLDRILEYLKSTMKEEDFKK